MIYCEERPYQNSNGKETHKVFRGRVSAHLMADTDEELKEYAKSIGIKLSWIQKEGKWDCHFDIVGMFLEKVYKDTRVVKMSRVDFVNKFREKRAKFNLAGI